MDLGHEDQDLNGLWHLNRCIKAASIVAKNWVTVEDLTLSYYICICIYLYIHVYIHIVYWGNHDTLSLSIYIYTPFMVA